MHECQAITLIHLYRHAVRMCDDRFRDEPDMETPYAEYRPPTFNHAAEATLNNLHCESAGTAGKCMGICYVEEYVMAVNASAVVITVVTLVFDNSQHFNAQFITS